MSKVILVVWCIKKFPKGVKNRFKGMAHMKGKTVRVALLEAVEMWIKAQGGIHHG